jgi:hypothetical protein
MQDKIIATFAILALGCGATIQPPPEPPQQTPKASTPGPDLSGPPDTISTEELESTQLRIQYSVPECVEIALGAKRTIEASITVEPNGTASTIHVGGRFLEGDEIQCLERRFGEIEYPRTERTWILEPSLMAQPPADEGVVCAHPEQDPLADEIRDRLRDEQWISRQRDEAEAAIGRCDVNREVETLELAIRTDDHGRPTRVTRLARDGNYFVFHCAAEKACKYRFHPTGESSLGIYKIRMRGPESPETIRIREIDAEYEKRLELGGTRQERIEAWRAFVKDVLRCETDENADFEDAGGCSYRHRDDADRFILHLTRDPAKDRKAKKLFRAAEKKRPKKVVIRGSSHGEIESSGEKAEKILKLSMEQYKEVQAISSPEWSVAAGYRIGQLYELFVDAIRAVEPPAIEPGAVTAKLPNRTEVPVEVYEERYRREIVRGAEEMTKLVVKQYRETLDLAGVLGVANKWTEKIEQRLEALDAPAEQSEK